MIIVITGPTALGKSKTAIEVAKTFDAEIVNGDAFQIYQELDIGVAKPSKDELSQVTHHLYSLIPVTDSFSIFTYQKLLREKIEEILSRKKDVVIVGGSGLYIRSALYDYEFKESENNVDLSKYDNLSNSELHDLLKKIDIDEANKIHVNNRKRIIRALTIYEENKINKTTLLSEQKHELIYKDTFFFVRDLDREKLYKRINDRVDEMFAHGLLDEVKHLYNKYDHNLNCFKAIGYKELFSYLNNEISLEDAIELIKKNSRNYAKRQMTFIRHQFPTIFYKNDEELISFIKEHKGE